MNGWKLLEELSAKARDTGRDECVELLQRLLSLLRAQYWLYQNLHWEAQGNAFYGNHLLFQRIYEGDDEGGGIQGEVDALAEKMVGAYGNESVCPITLIKMAHGWITLWDRVKDPFCQALYSEQCAHVCTKKVYDRLKELNALSLGMDDFLMSLDSAHETNEYLLRQVLRTRETSQQAAPEWAVMKGR